MRVRTLDRLRYWFDNLMSKGILALIALLAAVSLVFIVVVSLIVVAFKLFPPEQNLDFAETLWASLLRTLDPGTMGQDAGPGYRFAMLVVTIGGLIVVASLISIVSSAFDTKVEQLRKGRSRVLERNHTLILGWNSKIYQILSELIIANESEKRSTIVILADRDKVEMEDDIKSRIPHHGKTRLVIRSGDPMHFSDLQLTGVDEAKSVIILSPDEPEDADTFAIKTSLALLNNANRATNRYQIVSEIRNARNLEVAQLVGGTEVTWVLAEELISRLIVQTSRQSGLSAVFSDLLDFDGAEIYLAEPGQLVGKTYREVSLSFSSAAVLGVIRANAVYLNPPADTVIEADDKVVVVADDDSSIRVGSLAGFDETAIVSHDPEPQLPERTLVLGSNASLNLILKEIDSCSAAGSDVFVIDQKLDPIDLEFKNITINLILDDPTNRNVLQAVNVASFEHVIVLADRALPSIEQADAKTLLTLLHLRMLAKAQDAKVNIVTEMLNDRNRELAQSSDADDFIVSDKLVSNMITMLSENIKIKEILQMLFSTVGPEIRLLPASWFVKLGVEVDFDTISEAALRRGQSALGYRVSRAGAQAEVIINPPRKNKVVFGPDDRVVVLSEEQ